MTPWTLASTCTFLANLIAIPTRLYLMYVTYSGITGTLPFLHHITKDCLLAFWKSMYEVSLNVVSITMCFAFAYQSVCRRRSFVRLTGRCAFEQKGDSRCRGPSEEVYRECSEGIAQYSSWHWLFQQIPGEGRKTRIACLL